LREFASGVLRAAFVAAARLLWHAGLTGWLLRRSSVHPAVLVLTYHRVAEEQGRGAVGHRPNIIDRDLFRSHLAWLSSWCRPVSTTELREFLGGRGSWSGVGYLVTFDDGYRDVLDAAVPILEAAGARAVVMVTSGILDGTLVLPADVAAGVVPGQAPRLYLDARSTRELRERGVEVGAHSVSHRPLEELEAVEQEAEIRHSRSRLEEVLGGAVEVFSWPIGRVPGGLRELARRAGFTLVFANDFGAVLPGDDPLDLPRIAAVEYSVPVLAGKVLVALLAGSLRRWRRG
jgi:peptidoglycan/xylan/chitin deacetylase (PgdA/CDA1 family)